LALERVAQASIMKAATTVDVGSPSRLAQRAGIAILCCIAVSVTIVFSGINRPLWIDEVLHFAFGGYDSTQDVWRAIVRSIKHGLNLNQTGVYMLVDYWLLKAFGASAIWLRMPSSIGALVLFSGAVCVLRTRGFSYAWQVAVLLLLVSENFLMYFVAEARPYMLLAATPVGVLAYYGADVHRRHWFISVVGWISALVGAAIHPYFLPYYFLVVGLTYADRISWNLRRIAAKDIWRHLQPAMLSVTLAIYFGVGMLTWMPRQQQLADHPFGFVPRNSLPGNMVYFHFEFLFDMAKHVYPRPLLLFSFIFLAALGAITILALARSSCRSLLSPLALIFGALLLSGLLSLASYLAHYWILPRQWVASIALTCVGTVWLCAAGAELLPAGARRGAGIAVAIFAAFRAEAAVVSQFDKIDIWRAQQSIIALNAGHVSLDQLPPAGVDEVDAEWVALANQNVLVGGPVWPIFQRFYQ